MIDHIDFKCGSTIFQEEVISKASALDPFNIHMQAPHLVFPHLEKLTCLYRRHERLYLRFISENQAMILVIKEVQRICKESKPIVDSELSFLICADKKLFKLILI